VSVPLEQLPEVPRRAWTRLRDELSAILGDDLIAVWAYGGTTAVDGPPRSADLDTYVIVRPSLDTRTAQAIEEVQTAIAGQIGVDWDAWYVLEEDARRPEAPRHAYREDRRDTSWAINRAHWLAGRYALVYGREPAELVPPPTWSELEVDLHRELEHLERHVAEGDTDPYEATYAFLNGSRILRAVETGDVAISKRSAGKWALEHLPVRWHAVLSAAGRAYDGQASSDDADLLANEMAPFVAMVKERLPTAMPQDEAGQPRWSGY
jgi:aminoglycoside adenylyltransferase-like protein